MQLSQKPVVAERYGALPQRPRMTLQIVSMPTQVSAAVSRIGDWLAAENVDAECIGDFTLVLAEALNNVIEHAYGADVEGAIEIRAAKRPSTLSVQIIDEGTPFDGPPEAVTLDTEDREITDLPEGGYGWFLIKSLTDDVHFSNEGGRNKLTLVVALRSIGT